MPSKPIPPEEAWRRLERLARPLPAVTVARREAAGRVLARGVAATVDVPAHDVSAMDGFALAGAPEGPLEVVGAVMAGDAPGAPGDQVPAGATLRIMTGAPVPAGADRVIPVELATVDADEGGERVTFQGPGEAGDNIRRRAEITRRGDPLLPAGALLTPGALSLLATHGHADLAVHRRPRVALVVTGDEVVPPDETPAPGQLRDSHTDFVLAACRSLGVRCDSLGVAPDEREALRDRIESGLDADVLLLSGGVSMGEADLVAGVLQELDCETLFDRVAIQPGKPLTVAVHAAGHAADGSIPASPGVVFGLPGNPASVMVSFWLFVRPFLRRLMGLSDGFWHGALAGELTAPLPGSRGRDRFLPAEIEIEDGAVRVRPVSPVGSHDLGAYARGTALVRVPVHAEEEQPAGAPCQVLPIAGWPG
jgi:molybdopterin molybdotransferase